MERAHEHEKIPIVKYQPLPAVADLNQGGEEDSAEKPVPFSTESETSDIVQQGALPSGSRDEEGLPRSALRRSRSSSLEASSTSVGPTTASSPGVIPLDVKSAALERVLGGEMQAAVARDLNIRPSTLAHWWARRDEILAQVRQAAADADLSRSQFLASSGGYKELRKNKRDLRSKKQSLVVDVKLDEQISAINEENALEDGKLAEIEEEAGDEHEEVQLETPRQESEVTALSSAGTARSRRQSLGGSSTPTILPARQLMPLEVKQEALRKILAGESQASVARHLDLPVSTVSTWWRKRETILLPAELERAEEFPDLTVQELERSFIESRADGQTDVVCNGVDSSHQHGAVQPENEEEPERLSVSSLPPVVPVKPIDLADVKRELLKSMKSAFTGKAESQASPASGPAPKKKKSLELLANNLLQKALAQLAGDVEPPPKVSVQNGPVVELVTKTDSDPAEQVSSCPAEPVPSCPIEPIPSCPAEPVHFCPAAGKPARDVPSLGLCLIADSYVSSEEEES